MRRNGLTKLADGVIRRQTRAIVNLYISRQSKLIQNGRSESWISCFPKMTERRHGILFGKEQIWRMSNIVHKCSARGLAYSPRRSIILSYLPFTTRGNASRTSAARVLLKGRFSSLHAVMT